jgi:hypothetical protein
VNQLKMRGGFSMKRLCKCLAVISIITVLISCSKEPGNEFLDKEEYLKYIDVNSELVIVIPDIQDYISLERRHYYLETIIQWVLMMKESGFKIKAVVQTGDVTNYNRESEWKAAADIFSDLDGKVPYILTTGNHDYGVEGLTDSRFTHFSDYFNYTGQNEMLATYHGKFENSVLQISIHNQPFQIISLEFAPNDSILNWADSIIKADESMKRMILTHSYLYQHRVRYDYSTFGLSQDASPYSYALSGKEKVNDGEEIWDKLIFPNKNVQFVICGHRLSPDNIGHLISENNSGNNCLQLMFNAQDLPNGGDGWIQILEFREEPLPVHVITHSAMLNTWNIDSLHQFLFDY